MGQWDDKFERAERKWANWTMREYAQSDRVIGRILEDKAREHPYREVFQFREQALTFEQLNQRVNRVANGFLGLGIKAGDKVALVLPNRPEFLLAWFGLNKIGAVCVPINVALKGAGLAYQIDQADCVALVAEDGYLDVLDAIADQLPKIRHSVMVARAATVRLTTWPGVESLHFDQLLAHADSTPRVIVDFRDLATISYTSGTTGLSKGVMISHHYWYEIWSQAVKYSRYTDDDVLYTGLPFFHTSAHGTTGPAILTGAKAVLVERFSASRMLDDCRRWNCTSAKYIGGIISILMKQDPSPDDADNPLRLLVGAAAPRHLWHAFERRFNTRLLELYGMTECSSCLVNPIDERRPGSCGKAITGYEVKLVDDDDNEVAPGQVGEFVVRPQRPHLGTTGYYRQPEATLELFRNLWIHTGDLATQDGDGYFFYVDRKKQALRRRGENISSFEVEAVISAHPAVVESCVVGVPSELGEDEVKAVIVLKPGHQVSEAELVAWCEPRLAYFAIPRYIAFRGHLPKTPSERVEKYRLRDEGVTADCWDREQAGLVLKR
ncbi:ATP-dependent acyl-CoA ligase [Paraburkholderia strydomiana]|uniref:ATP-dependent acyl-CoA ligase n=1 Tax=Paraburkholderia strydomiana TaxID=1245417 RepID=UPI001BE5AB25|nr:ATP-dependent acyl-CoA ligase [Paraburkholderia strydomiana]MBT2793543.1 ATP-dependent acyl-CoA ligase [Paraburkholderia strydomiana]